PGARPGGLAGGVGADLGVVPADDGHRVVGLVGAGGRLVGDVVGRHEGPGDAVAGADGPGGRDAPLDRVEVCQVGAGRTRLDVADVEALVGGVRAGRGLGVPVAVAEGVVAARQGDHAVAAAEVGGGHPVIAAEVDAQPAGVAGGVREVFVGVL